MVTSALFLRILRWRYQSVTENVISKGYKGQNDRSNGIYQGKLLWRFGVLLAGDDAAHTLLPNLPLAPAEEIAAVEQGAGG